MNSDIPVRDVANREYVGVSESDGLVETVELLLSEGSDTALVLRGREPVGVLVDRDVLRVLVEGDVSTATVDEAMREHVPTIAPDASLEEAADRIAAEDVHRLVVTDGEGPVGVVSEGDLLATRPHAAGPNGEGATVEATAEAAGAGATGAGVGTDTERYQDQSICEGCGTLTGDLASFNGQLLCADCRDM